MLERSQDSLMEGRILMNKLQPISWITTSLQNKQIQVTSSSTYDVLQQSIHPMSTSEIPTNKNQKV